MSNKVEGIKSVDFVIKASGYGVVNWNGSVTLSEDGEKRDNHTLPKLRGFSNLNGKESEKGFKFKKDVHEIDLKETPMYVSQNCIRHFLYKESSNDTNYVLESGGDVSDLLCSEFGLLHGYVITASTPLKRTSPLFITDFVDTLGNGNFEQLGNSSAKKEKSDKKSNAIFSKTTFGETEYEAFGSISIEELQFISLDLKFDRACVVPSDSEVEGLRSKLENWLKTLDDSKNPTVTFSENFVRNGSIYDNGEAGFLLNDDAVDILVKNMIDRIVNLYIKQGKGMLLVDDVIVDYNDDKPLRIKSDDSNINTSKTSDYAVYYSSK